LLGFQVAYAPLKLLNSLKQHSHLFGLICRRQVLRSRRARCEKQCSEYRKCPRHADLPRTSMETTIRYRNFSGARRTLNSPRSNRVLLVSPMNEVAYLPKSAGIVFLASSLSKDSLLRGARSRRRRRRRIPRRKTLRHRRIQSLPSCAVRRPSRCRCARTCS
jgi:hypothetical protein